MHRLSLKLSLICSAYAYFYRRLQILNSTLAMDFLSLRKLILLKIKFKLRKYLKVIKNKNNVTWDEVHNERYFKIFCVVNEK